MHSLRSPLSIALSLIISVALMPVQCLSLLEGVIAQKTADHTPPPRPGKPEATLPDWRRFSASRDRSVSLPHRFPRLCVPPRSLNDPGTGAVSVIPYPREHWTIRSSVARRSARTHADV